MSHHIPSSNSGPSFDPAARIITRGAEAGGAMYALDHAARRTPIGAEGNAGEQAARTAGNFVFAAVLWHFVIAPYLVVTAAIFAIPTIVATVLIDTHHSMRNLWPVVVLLFVAGFSAWVRYALYKWLWRKFIRPVDAGLSGRRLDDPTRKPQTRVRESPKQYRSEYNELSDHAREQYLNSHSNGKGVWS
jgi:hypothetical protein